MSKVALSGNASGTGTVTLASPNTNNNPTFTLPSADGTNGQVLQTNGSGTLSFANATSLASPLAVTGNSTAGAEIRLPEDTDNGSNYVALKAADNIASNVTFTLPSADGTSGQVLQTNGSGTLSFTTPSSVVQLLTTVNIANVRTHNFTGLSGNFNYQLYVIATSSTSFAASSVLIQIGTGSASTSGYYWGGVNSDGTTISGSEQDASNAFYPFGNVNTLSNAYAVQISANIFTATSQNPTFQCRANGYGNANNTQTASIAGANLGTTSMSSIHLDLGTTNFTGAIYLLGVKNA